MIIRSDAIILRNRLERHETRRHFGADAAPWNPARVEPAEESQTVHSPSSSSRHSAEDLSSNRVSEQAAVDGSNPIPGPLSTGQSMGRFRDPISMEMPSQTFRSLVQIELVDSRIAVETVEADSHVAPAVQNADAPRQVSISAPPAFSDFRESAHRYPLSPSRPHDNSTFVENSMDLTSTASRTGGVPPTTTAEMTTRPSVIFGRDSYLPLSNLMLLQRRREVAPSMRYPMSNFGVVVSSTGSLLPSQVPRSSASAENFKRLNCFMGNMSFFSEYAARGTGAVVYSQCPMPRGGPCYREPSFMHSGAVAPPSFSAAASQMSGYGARTEPVRAYHHQQLPPSVYYPPGHFSKPVMSTQQSFPHVPSHLQYFGDIPYSFSQILMAAPLPAVTGFLSAPMHTAASFQPYPGRFDVSAPGMSQDASFFERSSLIKEKRTCELLSKWHISFKGEKGKDPESFIADLTNCKETYKLTLDEIVKALPSALDGESWQWFRREYQFWKTYEDFVDAFWLRYSFEDVQERLRKELEVRNQGPSE